MKNLHLWLDFVNTKEIIPLFKQNAKEYIIPKLADVYWSIEPKYVKKIAKERVLSEFQLLESEKEYSHIFGWLLEKGELGPLLQVYKYLLD